MQIKNKYFIYLTNILQRIKVKIKKNFECFCIFYPEGRKFFFLLKLGTPGYKHSLTNLTSQNGNSIKKKHLKTYLGIQKRGMISKTFSPYFNTYLLFKKRLHCIFIISLLSFLYFTNKANLNKYCIWIFFYLCIVVLKFFTFSNWLLINLVVGRVPNGMKLKIKVKGSKFILIKLFLNDTLYINSVPSVHVSLMLSE